MTPFLYKVEKAIPMSSMFIEWKIHNVCNYDCSFCGEQHKDGSNRWLSLEKYKEYTDKIVIACQGQPFWIQITGGEPTLYPNLIDLLVYMKGKGAYVSMISNGARTIRWWKELIQTDSADHIYITYHSEQTDDYRHIAEIINLFHDAPTSVTCLITHTIKSLPQAFIAYDYLVEHTGAYISLNAMDVTYDIYTDYSQDQLDKLKRAGTYGKISNKMKDTVPVGLNMTYDLKTTYYPAIQQTVDSQYFMKTRANKFAGWECAIGQNNMRIDYETVYRGVCEVGGYQRLSDETISFATGKVICTRDSCGCAADLIATKSRPLNQDTQTLLTLRPK